MSHSPINLPRLPVEALLTWYRQNARVLPWRSEPTPYRVWVSEIMLQQTRVEAVIPYFHRFVEALPHVAALADAPEEQLLKLWEGLGYYSRARNLQKAARQVMERHGGQLPADYEQLLTLPGVGEYTAGAVASIAFGIPTPAVDGNVLRVVARVCASEADIALPEVKRACREALAAQIPPRQAGDFTQAMMELGATVCLPNGQPRCLLCPFAGVCEGYRRGNAPLLPVKTGKKPRRMEQRTIAVVISQGRTLIRRRAGKGLLAGLWEPLNLEGALASPQVKTLLEELGLDPLRMLPLGPAKHIFTHIEWQMQGWLVQVAEAEPLPGWVWADAAALDKGHPLPSAFKVYTEGLPRWLGESFER